MHIVINKFSRSPREIIIIWTQLDTREIIIWIQLDKLEITEALSRTDK